MVKTHDLVPLWRSAYFADPHNWTGYMYNSRNIGAGNSSFYRNARFDELTDKALILTEQEERRPLYEEASRILVEDAAGLFIYNTKWFGPFTKNVHDVRFCPIGDAGALGQAMYQAAMSPDLADRGRQAMRLAQSRFSASVMYRNYEALYESCLARN